MFSKHQDIMSGLRGAKPPSAEKPRVPMEPKKVGGEGGDSGGMEFHPHDDGSAHTVIGGEKAEHPDHLAALTHMAHHAEPGGKHMMLHHDGFSMKSHGVDEAGEHEGTHEHENVDEAKSAMEHFMGGEGHESEGGHEGEGGDDHEHELGGY